MFLFYSVFEYIHMNISRKYTASNHISQSAHLSTSLKMNIKGQRLKIASYERLLSACRVYTTPKMRATHQRQGMMTRHATWHPLWW